MSKRKKQIKSNISDLTDAQRHFIVMRCQRMGSIRAIELEYKRDDAVSQFARLVAKGLFGGSTRDGGAVVV